MSSGGFASTLDLRLAPSGRGLRWVYAMHLLPLAMLPVLMQPGVYMVLAAFALGASWVWLRRHPVIGFGPRALTRLVWQPGTDPGAGWHVYDQAGRHAAATLLGDTYVTQHLMVLNFRIASGRRRSRALLGDELPAEPLRRLRAHLLAGPRDESSASDVSGSGGAA